jgi:hypothetical protein
LGALRDLSRDYLEDEVEDEDKNPIKQLRQKRRSQRTLGSTVVDIPNGYSSDVVSYWQTRVAHGGGMADSQLGDLVAGGMAD